MLVQQSFQFGLGPPIWLPHVTFSMSEGAHGGNYVVITACLAAKIPSVCMTVHPVCSPQVYTPLLALGY